MSRSPIKRKLSKLLLWPSIRRFKDWRWFGIESWLALYEQFRSHFLFLKLTATERVSMLYFDLLINNLDYISSQMYRRSPPPFPFLSYLYETLKPFIWNWAVGKESRSFVSNVKSKSILLFIMYVSASGLFLTKLILGWPNISLSGEWILISLSPFFVSVISFYVADLWKTVSSQIGASTLLFIRLCFSSFVKEIPKFMS